MKLGSLFDGSGGFPLAGVLNGIEPVWASEVEPFPIRVTTKRFPQMKHLGNICEINGAEVEPVDIITGGSPCQDMSVAGKRAGMKHSEFGDEEATRSGLFMEQIRIIKEMREATNGEYPRFMVWENVPGAFSSNKGKDFQAVLEETIRIADKTATVPEPPKGKWSNAGCIVGDGYSIAWRTLDAQYWGVPQRRKRIFLVADFAGESAGEILFKPDSLRGYSAESGKAREGIAADVERGTDGGCGVECVAFACNQRDEVRDMQGKSGALQAQPGMKQQTFVLQENMNRLAFASEKASTLRAGAGAPKHLSDMIGRLVVLNDQGGSSINVESGNTSPTLRAQSHQHEPVIAMATKQFSQNISNNIANPLLADDYKEPQMVCIPIHDKATRYSGGGDTRNNDGSANGLGVGKTGDPFPTITAGDRHAVCFEPRSQDGDPRIHGDISPTINTAQGGQIVCFGQGSFAQYQENKISTLKAQGGDLGGGSENLVVTPCTASGKLFTRQRSDELSECGVASCQAARQYKDATDVVIENGKPPRKYIVRRLTPLECCRLQGFPDGWCDGLATEEPTEDAITFWSEVFETHRKIMGTSTKPKSRNQIVKWLKDPYSDSAIYKLWGNGLAVFCAEFVMGGIVEVGRD